MLFESALNHYLSLDPESRLRLTPLHNKVVLIEFKQINKKIFLHFHKEKISVLSESNNSPDTIITGTPLRLLHLTLSPALRQKFFADDVSIVGNLEVGQQVIHLFDAMEIDWEELLAERLGDSAAYRIGNVARQAKSWVTATLNNFTQDLNEYLHEEIKVAPTAEMLQLFFNEIDEARMQADRLEARILQLERVNRS